MASPIEAVKMPVCRPKRPALTVRKTSSTSSYGRRLTTGPNTSSHTTFMAGLASAITVGSTAAPWRLPPASTRAPPALASAIQPSTRWAARSSISVGRRIERIAEFALVHLVHYQLDEFVVDAAVDIHRLHRDAALAGKSHGF